LSRWLHKTNAARAEGNDCCKRCQTSAAGKKGYAATVEKYGKDFALKYVQRQQLNNPSSSELAVKGMLDELNIEYDFQVIQGGFVLDFVLSQGIIEVNGYWHNATRKERDQTLVENSGLPVMFIDAALLKKDSAAVRVQIAAFAGGIA
jgi:very-short-patch-repair endonuclease